MRGRSGICHAAWVLFAALGMSYGPTLGDGLAVQKATVTDNGDHDGFADTNETVGLSLLVQNTTGAPLPGVHVRLATTTPDLVCLTSAVVDLGDFVTGQVKPTPPFILHVLDVDRAALGLGPYDPLAAGFRVLVYTDNGSFPRPMTPLIWLDLDLDVAGGANPTTFFESFESATLGAFEVENLDGGRHDPIDSDGYRCQYDDPDWLGVPVSDCYLGATASQADATFWGLSGPSFSPLGGRAASGTYSLYFGVDLGPPKSWTTPTATLEAARTKQPIHLGWSGTSPVLSIRHQASLMDHRCLAEVPEGHSLDRAVVMAQVADESAAPVGPWIKLYAFQNAYDQPHDRSFGGCAFDPVDDGNDEDDFFEPGFPGRRLGPSATCAPEESFANVGETSDLFDASHVGRADGPAFAGFWGIGSWIESRFDLSRFRGRSVRLRFLASTSKLADGVETWEEFTAANPVGCDDGWWIDDVAVTGVLDTPAAVSADVHDNSSLGGVPGVDGDGDGIFDVCDNCGTVGNADQGDQDLDGLGDACDPCIDEHLIVANSDADGDGRCSTDNCPATYNPDQLDGDLDGSGRDCDCADLDPDTYPGAPEHNDGRDNQCPGDGGYGLADELTAAIGFFDPGDKNRLSWPPQVGATTYQVLRATSADFSSGCTLVTLPVGQTFHSAGSLLPGQRVRYLLVRAMAPNLGSWGRDSSGLERTFACGP